MTLGVLAAASLITYVAYALLRVPDYTWYYAPLVYLAAILAGVTIEEVGGYLANRHHVGLVVVPIVVVLLLVIVGLNSTEKGPPRPGYEQAAAWINEHTAPSGDGYLR